MKIELTDIGIKAMCVIAVACCGTVATVAAIVFHFVRVTLG